MSACIPAFAEVKTGKLGGYNRRGVWEESDATYTFEEAPGLLTIRGGSVACFQFEYLTHQMLGYDNIKKVVFVNATLGDDNSPNTPAYYRVLNFANYWTNLTEVDLSGLDMSKASDMQNMFYNCPKLEKVNFNGVKTSNVTFMNGLFYGCTSLKNIDLTGLDTSNMTHTISMFEGCSELQTIDWGDNFDVSNVISMSRMFGGCVKLTELDLSNWKTSNVTDMSYMFQGCTNLMTIYAGDGWTTKSVSYGSNMFSGCTSIVGAMGTMYDENHVDQLYARVDNPPTWPGYLCIHKEKPAITPPTPLNPSYTGNPLALISAGSSSSGVTMTYTLDEENVPYSAAIPTATEPGEYTVWWFVDETTKYMPASGYVDVTVGKGDPTVSDPTAKSLTYTGEAQELVNGDITPAEMTMLYALDNGDYSPSLPKATDAGNYTVSFKAEETTHYKAYGPKSLTVEIKKADPKVIAPIALDLTYNGMFQTLIIPGSAEPGEMLYTDGTTTPPAQMNAGEYKVDYWVQQDAAHEKNYNGTQRKTITAKIEKDWPDFTSPKPKTLTFTNTAQKLADEGWSEAGTTMYYRLKDITSWDLEVPTGTDIGTYEIEYYVRGNANYRDQPVRSVISNIVSHGEAEETNEQAEEAKKQVGNSPLNNTEAGNALIEALSNSNLATQTAATEVVNTLTKSYSDSELSELNLTAYDIEKAIENKTQEAEDKAAEDISGEVPDSRVPAATDLLANSDNETLQEANENLSVQPKLIQPEVNVESNDKIASTLGVAIETDIIIDEAPTNLSEQASIVEDLMNKVSGDLAKGNGVVIAAVLSGMRPDVTGFFALKVNLRNLMPGRVLKFWPSVSYFKQSVSGDVATVSLSESEAEGDFFFVDEDGDKVNAVTGDASKMIVVPYLTAGTVYEDAFITADATSADIPVLKKLAKESGSNDDNNDALTNSSSGCDAGFGLAGCLAVLTLAVLTGKRR